MSLNSAFISIECFIQNKMLRRAASCDFGAREAVECLRFFDSTKLKKDEIS